MVIKAPIADYYNKFIYNDHNNCYDCLKQLQIKQKHKANITNKTTFNHIG